MIIFFLKLCDRPKWKQRKENKGGRWALSVAMLTPTRVAFMFKPLPEKSKTERKRNHTDTQKPYCHYNTGLKKQKGKNKKRKRPFCLLFSRGLKLVINLCFFLLDPTTFYCPLVPPLWSPTNSISKETLGGQWQETILLRNCPLLFPLTKQVREETILLPKVQRQPSESQQEERQWDKNQQK